MADGSMPAYFPEPEVFSPWLLERVSKVHGMAGDPNEAEILFVRVGYRIDADMLDAMPKMRVVVSATTGVDHIDLAECGRRGIEVLTLRGHTEFLENLTNTAEHTFALLLALCRRVVPAYRDVLEGRWRQAEHRGYTLAGRRFAIVGYGRLGKMAARIAQGFGMRVLAYDPHVAISAADVTPVHDLHDLAAQAGIMSLHASLNNSSEGMIDSDVLGRLPAGAMLVNTARGQLIDEGALLKALRDCALAGAALDVIRNETSFGAENPLLQYAKAHDNLVLTPHIAGQTHEAVLQADKHIYSELERWCTANAS